MVSRLKNRLMAGFYWFLVALSAVVGVAAIGVQIWLAILAIKALLKYLGS